MLWRNWRAFTADLDGDGTPEFVTIEPFHGDTLAVYRRDGQGKIAKAWSYPLAFGHVVWAGSVLGQRAILAGNRAGDKDLLLLRHIEALDRRANEERAAP